MSHKADDGTIWISEEPPGKCELCGAVEETRPYGPGGRQICHPCGLKDEERTEAWMGFMLFGDPLPEKYEHELVSD